MGNSLKALLFFEAIENGNLNEVIRLHEKEQAAFDLRRNDEVRHHYLYLAAHRLVRTDTNFPSFSFF